MEAVFFPIVAFIFFLYFTEIITFNIIYEDELIVDIDFLILGVRLYPTRAKKRKKTKSRKNRDKKPHSIILRIIARIIPSSEVTIDYLYVNVQNSDYVKSFIGKGLSIWAVNSFIKIIEEKAKKLTVGNIFIDTFDNNNKKPILYANVSIPLYIFSHYIFVIIKDRKSDSRKAGRKCRKIK